MSNDPLAHLYAETGAGDPDVEIPTRSTSLEALTAEAGAGEEKISDRDLAELATLVEARLDRVVEVKSWQSDEPVRSIRPGLPDAEAAELGLGHLEEGELVLNNVGRAVIKIIADRRAVAEARRQQ